MGKGHKWVIAIILTPLVVILVMIFTALLTYAEDDTRHCLIHGEVVDCE